MEKVIELLKNEKQYLKNKVFRFKEDLETITEIDKALQLQQTGVMASCYNTYIGKEFVYTSRITNCKTIFKVARTDDRYSKTILISENKNRYFLDEVIPHN